MKKAVFFVVLAMVVIGSLAAQSVNYAQIIVGTWTDEKGTVWVFNANGTGTSGSNSFYYGISATGVLHIKFGNSSDDFTLYISPDGKRMFIDIQFMLQKK